VSQNFIDTHRKTLVAAQEALAQRGYWSAYPEAPSGRIYGETAKADGLAAFEARLNKQFELAQPGTIGTVGEESSPFGMKLGVSYPRTDLDVLLPAVELAAGAWGDATVEARTGVCLEILQRLNQRSFELANAVMHTTGQGFVMAFQAGGPHAQDRGLEAVAYAYQEMKRYPESSTWKKQVGKDTFVTLEKRWRISPRGIAVTVGCSTFPTWNGYPGIFASLATGNAVVVKPHPGAVLPLAITVEIGRAVLKEAGFDPNVLTLVADSAESPITEQLVTRNEVKIVDYTGSSAFGDWIENHARQAVVFTEKAGVNSTVLDSVDDLKAVTGNLAFSLCLYSGQMCTTPQNIFIPESGIRVGGKQLSFDDTAAAIVKAVDWLLSDPARGAEILGGIQNAATLARVDQTAADPKGDVLRKPTAVANEQFPDARVRSPLIVKLRADQHDVYMKEMFGPIVYLIATTDTNESIEIAARTARELGAITAGVYSVDAATLEKAERKLADAGAAVSCNLTGQIFVNQSAAFSDFHVSGVNPSGNATLCDGAYVAGRFRVVQTRSPVTA
jgi:phenylacetic acid degradation protein paaN